MKSQKSNEIPIIIAVAMVVASYFASSYYHMSWEDTIRAVGWTALILFISIILIIKFGLNSWTIISLANILIWGKWKGAILSINQMKIDFYGRAIPQNDWAWYGTSQFWWGIFIVLCVFYLYRLKVSIYSY